MLLCLFLEGFKNWLQQHCFVHKPHQNSYIAFKHTVYQCLIPIENYLTFEGIITVLIEHITATEIHC